jgi:isopropylmalate/homocitrate/citramalate synthase
VLRKLGGVPSEQLEFHGHGDHYMGIANAVSAWLYGASINNGTLLGIGERAGNVPIEALVVWYARLRGGFDGMDPSVLRRISEYFSRIGYQVPRYQPIIGPNAFATAAGIHIDAQLKRPETYLPMDPGLVGNEMRITIGPYSGTSGVAYWLRTRLGVNVEKDDEVVRRIYERIMQLYDGGGKREPLDDEEIRRIIDGIF